LRVDGGLKTARDVMVAAMLGAEEFGFGTAALVALGCVMARKCHLNTCPVGIATQDPELRAKFKGSPEHVVTFLLHTAEQVRHELAALGLRSLDEAVGRVDLLRPKPSIDGMLDADAVEASKDFKSTSGLDRAIFPKGVMDLSALLHLPKEAEGMPIKCTRPKGQRNKPEDEAAAVASGDGDLIACLDDAVWNACRRRMHKLPGVDSDQAGAPDDAAFIHPALPSSSPCLDEQQAALKLHFPITNMARSVGARLSGEIASRFGVQGLPEGSIELNFHGVAGQSFGAFCNRGMRLILRGEAHDYVGKGMYGGEIVLAPPTGVDPESHGVICGNTVLFGATGGKLFAAG